MELGMYLKDIGSNEDSSKILQSSVSHCIRFSFLPTFFQDHSSFFRFWYFFLMSLDQINLGGIVECRIILETTEEWILGGTGNKLKDSWKWLEKYPKKMEVAKQIFSSSKLFFRSDFSLQVPCQDPLWLLSRLSHVPYGLYGHGQGR